MSFTRDQVDVDLLRRYRALTRTHGRGPVVLSADELVDGRSVAELEDAIVRARAGGDSELVDALQSAVRFLDTSR